MERTGHLGPKAAEPIRGRLTTSDRSRFSSKIARFGASILCAALALEGRARAQQVLRAEALERTAAPSFSLRLDGALAAAATYPLETGPRPATSWTGEPLARPSWSFEAARLSSPFQGAAAPVAASSTRRFLTATAELALVELLPWVWDRYIVDESWARISWHTVSENFKDGFGFDDDNFNINQSGHPYQGSFFFEAGRSNGYNYWESGLFALAGSLIWECCMENTRPSINDLVNTTLGGMARGEAQHRLSVMLLDNTSTGGERFWRELGAGLLNPVGAITRLVNGDMGRRYPNPEDRLPDSFHLSAELGYRRVDGEIEDEQQGLVSVAVRYGDPFVAEVRQPLEFFTASIDLNFPGDVVITRFEERGILRSWELTDRAASVRHVFTLWQDYEYLNNEAEVFGAQMFSGGILSRYALGRGLFAETDLEAVAIALAGVKTASFENSETERTYDYGPGGGALAAVRLFSGERGLLSVGYGLAWIQSVNGVSDNNTLQFFRATAVAPIAGPVGVGGGYRWYSRKTSYGSGFFEPRQTQSEWRVFVSLAFGGSGFGTPAN